MHPVVPNASAATFLEIAITGAPDHGIFDPSVASDGTGKLYMSLSGVASTTPGGSFGTAAVRTYLASSGDQGKSWKLSGVINPDIAVTLGKAPTERTLAKRGLSARLRLPSPEASAVETRLASISQH